MCECCDYIAARGGARDDPLLVAAFERDWRRRLRSVISDGGWQLISVDESDATPMKPALTYTVGLWSHGHPELCVFGLDPGQAAHVLDEIAAGVCTDTARLDDGHRIEFAGWQLEAFRVPNPGEVVLRANAYYRRKPRHSVPALQLVYPDVHGVWPWEPGCHLAFGSQPMPGTFAG